MLCVYMIPAFLMLECLSSSVTGNPSQGSTYEVLPNGPGCSQDLIATTTECKTAAAALNFNGQFHVGSYGHAPPGCHVGHPSDGWAYVYFNRNGTGTTGRSIYQSICRQNGTSKIPQALALTVPNIGCMEEDNIAYYGNTINYTRVGNVAACAAWCGEVEACKFWSYTKSAKYCWIKTKDSDRRINVDIISGTKGCAVVCPDNQIYCSSGKCIQQEFICDGWRYCNDGSDEENCEDYVCPANLFSCLSGKPQCIRQTLRCDGVDDCNDGSDEENCEDYVCPANLFSCLSGKPQCILQTLRCDGVDDCKDGSDEDNCKDYVCPDNQFSCLLDKRKCIPQDWKCDGDKDCEDGSDEDDCNDHGNVNGSAGNRQLFDWDTVDHHGIVEPADVTGAIGNGRAFDWDTIDFRGIVEPAIKDSSRCCEQCRTTKYPETQMFTYDRMKGRRGFCYCLKKTSGKRPATISYLYNPFNPTDGPLFAGVCV